MSSSDRPGEADRWARVEAIFSRALERAPEERNAFLEDETGDDTELRREVEELLAAHDEPGFFDEAVRQADAERVEASGSGTGEAGDPTSPHPPGTRIGPYRVDGVLGRGGMGVVYEARRVDGEFDQEVALKVLPAGTVSGRLIERFRAERQILARLSHPNVARLLDGGVDARGRPWFAMERVQGTPLLDYCDANGLGLTERIDLFLAVCDAVQHAHRSLVVHRDLKPGNVLVDASGVPKLLDFGIAKLLDPEATGDGALETQVGVRVLTPAYAAPEQLRGEPANTASDIYQLGIVLYELLTGIHPFGSGATRDREPAPPSRATASTAEVPTRGGTEKGLRQRLRGDLDAIVLKALRAEPAQRYSSASELADDLLRERARRPVRARPDAWLYRANRFVRRNAVGLAAAAVLVAAGVAFTVGIARESRRTAVQRDRARAVSGFMQELFAEASPYASPGEDVTARDLLDRGAERVRSRLGAQPVIQASLMDAIGDAYWELGLSEEALALKEEALDLWRREAAGDTDLHPLLVASMARTARYRVARAELDASRPLLEEAEAGLGRMADAPAAERAGVLNDLGLAWQGHGDNERAEPFLEAAVEGFRAAPGGELTAAASLGNLAWLRLDRRDPDSAEALFREAYRLRLEALGPDHLLLANTLEGLGNLYVLTGRLPAADSAYQESLRIRTRGLPEDHYLTHVSALGLARVRARRPGAAPDTDSLFRAAVDGIARGIGASSGVVANARNEYAIFLRNHGRLEEAVAEFARAEEVSRSVFGTDHLNPAVITANRGWTLFLAGRPEEAVVAYEAALPVIREADPDGVRYLDNRQDFGIALCAVAGRQEEATAVLDQVVRGIQGAAPGDDRVLEARNALGQCLGRAGRIEEAEEILLGVLEATRDRAADDPYAGFARGTLVYLYETAGRTEDADRLRGSR